MQQLESMADAPGTMRSYETVYVLRGDATNEQVAEVNTRVRGIIEGMDHYDFLGNIHVPGEEAE